MSVLQSQPETRLADHVRACRIGDQLIFLDLRRNRYIGIGGPQLPAVALAILGRQAGDDAGQASSNAGLVDEWMRRLRAQRLLCDTPATEPMRDAPRLPEAIASLPVDDIADAATFEWRHLARLWRATFVTSTWLRRHSLAEIAKRVVALRARRPTQGDDAPPDVLHAAVACFMRLRPFALSSHDRCLNDSLALLHFLATQGLLARWVIGVRLHPFGAHSWVQSGGVVLNDLHERVRAYRPILVV